MKLPYQNKYVIRSLFEAGQAHPPRHVLPLRSSHLNIAFIAKKAATRETKEIAKSQEGGGRVFLTTPLKAQAQYGIVTNQVRKNHAQPTFQQKAHLTVPRADYSQLVCGAKS